MDIHVHVVTHTIPDPFGIAVSAVVVVTVNEVVFVVNGVLFENSGSAMRTSDIF
jgi:hypothetical protein